MKKKLYQKLADFLVRQVENAATIEMSVFWFNNGMVLDQRAIYKHDWYLE